MIASSRLRITCWKERLRLVAVVRQIIGREDLEEGVRLAEGLDPSVRCPQALGSSV